LARAVALVVRVLLGNSAVGYAHGVARGGEATAGPRRRDLHWEATVRIGAVVIVIVWLIVGLVAAGQRGYLGGSSSSCAKAGNTVITVIAGPLNYIGVNPKVNCDLPQPSQ
jgi:hypothetical protein